MSSNFKPGDEVELRSGGPPMTVSKLIGPDKVDCVWWDQPKQAYANREFEVVALKLIEKLGPSVGGFAVGTDWSA